MKCNKVLHDSDLSCGSARNCQSTTGFFFFLLVLALFFCLPLAVCAAPEEPSDQELVDAVLLVDTSGSMRITDPLRLRTDGARLFAQFLRKGDRLAIVEFAKSTKILRPLIEYNQSQESEVTRIINGVGDSGEYTDLDAAIEQAYNILQQDGRLQAQHVIILLSDGKMDPDPAVGSAISLTVKLFDDLLPKVRAKGMKVYTLSFSDQADKELLNQIAAAGDGIHWYTPASDKIHESFADLFLAVKKPQIVPLTSKGFKIDQEVEEATFYINREGEEDVAISSPSGERITIETKQEGIKWFRGQKFDVITIENPEAGQWQLAGLPKNEGFATLLTNLKLTTSWPPLVTSGEPTLLEVRLYESRKPVVLPEMTGVVRYAFQITPTDKVSEPVIRDLLSDDGKNGDRIARDGVYSLKVTLEDPGEYKLRVLASGPTFERHQQLAFRVKPRLVTLKIVSSEDALSRKVETKNFDETSEANKHADYIQAVLSSELSGVKRIELELFANDKDKKRYRIPVTRIDNTYEASTAKLPHDGEYTLFARIKAEGGRKKEINAESQILTYLKKPYENTKEAVEVVEVVGQEEAPVKVKEDSFPWLYLLILLVVNGLVGGALIKKLRKGQEKVAGAQVMDEFATIESLEAALALLEEKSRQTEINLEDPIFTDESLEIKTDIKLSSGDQAAEAPADEENAAEQEGEAAEAAEPAEENEETDQAESAEPEDAGDELLEELENEEEPEEED